MKKLAICFYGQPRFIDNDIVYKRYIELINQYDADVYIHSWISNTSSNMDASDWAIQHNFIEKLNSTKQIISMYEPKKVLIEPPQKFSFNNDTKETIKKLSYYSENNESNLLSHLTTMTKSINLIENSKSYDFLLVTRLDAYLYDFPNLNDIDKEKFYLDDRYNHWPDVGFLAGSKYKKAFDIIDNVDYLSTKICRFTPEEYKKQNYLKYFSNNDAISLNNLKLGLVRSNDGLTKVQI